MSFERTTRHSLYNLRYHYVFTPKYREPIFHRKIAERLKELFRQICEERDWVIQCMEVMPDYVHIFLSVPPKWSAADTAKILKGASARWLLLDHPALRKGGHLWSGRLIVAENSIMPL
jgi:putative transposase